MDSREAGKFCASGFVDSYLPRVAQTREERNGRQTRKEGKQRAGNMSKQNLDKSFLETMEDRLRTGMEDRASRPSLPCGGRWASGRHRNLGGGGLVDTSPLVRRWLTTPCSFVVCSLQTFSLSSPLTLSPTPNPNHLSSSCVHSCMCYSAGDDEGWNRRRATLSCVRRWRSPSSSSSSRRRRRELCRGDKVHLLPALKGVTTLIACK